MRRPDYRRHDTFIAPARPRAELWRFAAGLVFAVLGYVALSRMYFQVIYALNEARGGASFDAFVGGTTPGAMYALLFSFLCMASVVGITVRLIHRRPMRSLLGPLPVMVWQFRTVSAAMIALGALVLVLPPWGMGVDLVPNLAWDRWLVLLPVSLLAILVQVSAEEILFRGYIQQQLAARFASPLVWLVLPSALFALGHYLPESAGDNALLIAVWAGIFGMLMADLTARSGSLGPAIAVHLWNNVSAILIVAMPDDLSGLALYLVPFTLADTAMVRAWIPVDFAMMMVGWLAARLAIRR